MKRIYSGAVAALTTLTTLVALSAAAAPAAGKRGAAGIEGTVTQVLDGHTVLLAPSVPGPVLQVRLAGVEPPLPCQPWGAEARQALADWVLNHAVVVVASGGASSSGRISGTLTMGPDNINRRMVEEGHAWSSRSRWDQGPFVKQERMAHSLSRGLFADGGAKPPKEWQRLNGACPAVAR